MRFVKKVARRFLLEHRDKSVLRNAWCPGEVFGPEKLERKCPERRARHQAWHRSRSLSAQGWLSAKKEMCHRAASSQVQLCLPNSQRAGCQGAAKLDPRRLKEKRLWDRSLLVPDPAPW